MPVFSTLATLGRAHLWTSIRKNWSIHILMTVILPLKIGFAFAPFAISFWPQQPRLMVATKMDNRPTTDGQRYQTFLQIAPRTTRQTARPLSLLLRPMVANNEQLTVVILARQRRLGPKGKAEPCKSRCVTIQMVGPAKYQGNGLARLLAVRLCIALMGVPPPTQSSNPVIGAYKPPPFGIVAYGPPSGLPSLPDVAIPKPIAMANSLA